MTLSIKLRLYKPTELLSYFKEICGSKNHVLSSLEINEKIGINSRKKHHLSKNAYDLFSTFHLILINIAKTKKEKHTVHVLSLQLFYYFIP